MSAIQTYLSPKAAWLAPMAGVNDAAFRAICKSLGAELTFSEMVSSKGLHYASSAERSQSLLMLHPDETPAVIQIFGNEPKIMAEQAARICDMLGDSLAFIDINMGCPVPKVAEKGDGAGLMRDIPLATTIAREVIHAIEPYGKELSVKFRRGWDEGEENAVEFAKAMEEAGVKLLSVHGRYRTQFYQGANNLDIIAQVKQAVSIPVAASGDLFDRASVEHCFDYTGVDAVMIARGAIGNPWIFRELDGGAAPSFEERLDMLLFHARGIEEFLGAHALKRIRRHASSYCAGLPGATFFRAKLQEAEDLNGIEQLICEYRDYLSSKAAFKAAHAE